MSESRAARGRPKGSGLDDRARLLAVAQLLSADPTLKPTTAIKSTGITDPSTIRRLRDKYQSIKHELAAEVGGTAFTAPAPKKMPATEEPRTAALVANTVKKQSKPVIAATAKPPIPAPVFADEPTVSVAAPPSIGDPTAWAATLYGLSIQNFTNAIALQISFVENMMRMPHVATALRGQVAFNEMSLAFCPISPRIPKSLH